MEKYRYKKMNKIKTKKMAKNTVRILFLHGVNI